jgi:hypothetical protein
VDGSPGRPDLGRGRLALADLRARFHGYTDVAVWSSGGWRRCCCFAHVAQASDLGGHPGHRIGHGGVSRLLSGCSGSPPPHRHIILGVARKPGWRPRNGGGLGCCRSGVPGPGLVLRVRHGVVVVTCGVMTPAACGCFGGQR